MAFGCSQTQIYKLRLKKYKLSVFLVKVSKEAATLGYELANSFALVRELARLSVA